MAEIDLDAKELAEDMTMTVTILRYDNWSFRLWIALHLVRFAAWIAWINVEFENE